MDRQTLIAVLESADGICTTDGKFEVEEEHGLNLYLGQPGQAMVVRDVRRLEPADAFLAVVTGEPEATYYLEYGEVHALSTIPPEEKSDRRAGFA